MRIKIDDLNRIYSSNKRAFSNLNVNIEPGKSYLSVSNDIENIIFMCTRFPFQRCSFEKILFDNETIAKGDKAIQFFEESPLGGTQKTDGEPGFQQTTEKREDAIFFDLKHVPVYYIHDLPKKQDRSNSKCELFHEEHKTKKQ